MEREDELIWEADEEKMDVDSSVTGLKVLDQCKRMEEKRSNAESLPIK